MPEMLQTAEAGLELDKSALHLLHRADQCAFNAFYGNIDRLQRLSVRLSAARPDL